MMIRPSAALRNDYTAISKLAKSTEEPIYITKNGEGDLVVMSIEAFERREELIKLRQKLIQAEESRLSGVPGHSLEEVQEMLRKRFHEASD